MFLCTSSQQENPLLSLILYCNLLLSFFTFQNPITKLESLFYSKSYLLVMAKAGKLNKLKSAIKRWPSLTKLTRSSSAIAAAESEDHHNLSTPKDLHAVYVGKSRRRYLVGSQIIFHPLFQELIDRSSSNGGGAGGDNNGHDEEVVVVSCEVVLFEHLLWMLENGGAQLGSMEELVEFYTC